MKLLAAVRTSDHLIVLATRNGAKIGNTGRALAPYALAIAVVLLSIFVKLLLGQLGKGAPFLPFFPGIAFAALLGGGLAGALATVLSAAVTDYFWIAPLYSFTVLDFADGLNLAIFVFSGLIISYTAERLKRANLAARRLEASRLEDVERQVRQRTAQLAEATEALQREVAERARLENHFQRVVESCPIAMLMIGESGLIELVNSEAEHVFGYARDEMLGQSIDILVPERDRDAHLEHRKAFVRAPAQRLMRVSRELFGLRKDGRQFPIEIGLGPIVGPDSVKIIASVADISARKEMARALTANEQQLRLILDNIREHAICMLDPDGRVVSWNAGAERLSGYRRDEIVGANCAVFFLPEDVVEGKPQRLLTITAQDGHAETEGWRRRKDGSRFMASVTLNAVSDSSGALCGFVQVTRDVTERKNIEKKLIESNERFALAAEAAGLTFWDCDIAEPLGKENQPPAGFNHFALGHGADLTLGRGRIHPDDLAKVEAALSEAAARLRSFEAEYRIVTGDGRLRYLRSAASLKRERDGRGKRLLGVSFDVTELKETEFELERARDAAEAANRAKSDFLAVISHEIRTPMHAIMGMNALLLESDLSERQRKMASAIRDSARSLSSIIDDILDVSKLEAGKIEIDEGDFDLRELVEKAVELFAPRSAEKGLSLSADMTGVSRAALHGDAFRLRQILLNLVSNAIKFTERGSVAIIVSTCDGSDRTRVRVDVLDTGQGVDEKAKQRLFKPFEQGDSSTSRRSGGTGLGLSISKRLVELMGGQIGFSERLEGGSAFWFEMVLGRAAGALQARSAVPAEIDQEDPKPRHVGRILLAEDNPNNVDLATMILEGAGYKVDVANDGTQAIDALLRRRYDLVLMDMQMPRLDGVAAAREIRASERDGEHLPIVAMTANAMKNDQRRCFEAGMDDYFSKPFTPASLIDKVARWINHFPVSPAPTRLTDTGAPPVPAVIDESAAVELRAYVSGDKFALLLGHFLDELERRSLIVMRLRSTPQLEEIGREAHQLIMGAGMFGARQVQDLATRLQSACAEKDATAADKLIESLASASAVASVALRHKYGIAVI